MRSTRCAQRVFETTMRSGSTARRRSVRSPHKAMQCPIITTRQHHAIGPLLADIWFICQWLDASATVAAASATASVAGLLMNSTRRRRFQSCRYATHRFDLHLLLLRLLQVRERWAVVMQPLSSQCFGPSHVVVFVQQQQQQANSNFMS